MTPQNTYVCQNCGANHSKWAGKCGSCGKWNSIIEEAARENAPKGMTPRKGQKLKFVSLDERKTNHERIVTNISEFDRVCGGGLVPGSAILVGGDPGIGKSTILLQVTAAIAKSKKQLCLYISGEEAVDQIRLRATRLNLTDNNVQLVSATNVRNIATSLDNSNPPILVVADSIQTFYVDNIGSAPGSVSQIRASAHELIRLAKSRGFVLLLVGHVTKEGNIAGPKILEHMVDCVLYFESERNSHFRILRAVKNRFGTSDEIGIFEMTEIGLLPVKKPSAAFLADGEISADGASVFAGIEGSRPMLMEVQALTAETRFGTPRRAVVGWDSNRLSMLIAVLETRCDLPMNGCDVYLNIAGGLRINEPAADLAVAAALISSIIKVPLSGKVVFFGEIGLSGEIRSVNRSDIRLKEAESLGFNTAIIPMQLQSAKPHSSSKIQNLKRIPIKHLKELVEYITTRDTNKTRIPEHLEHKE